MNKIENYNKKRVISSYFSITLSLTLILFLLGSLAILLLNAYRLGNYFKQQITISLFINDTALLSEVEQLQKKIESEPYTYKANFISKEVAAKQFSEEVGEDFLSFIGDNPLQGSIDVQLLPEYTSEEQMNHIIQQLKKNKIISDIVYDKPLAVSVYNNVEKISWIILSTTIVLTVISILLINASIRLSVYSKRFSIKTMQLVGATKPFIRRPFIRINIFLGIISAFCATTLLIIGLYQLNLHFKEFQFIPDFKSITIVISGLFLLSIFITWISTFFATNRYLNLHSDKLYH